MDDLFKQLEKKIKSLVEQHHSLKHSNHQLHQGKFQLSHEKELLIAKQQRAIKLIESLVSKLKTLEDIA